MYCQMALCSSSIGKSRIWAAESLAFFLRLWSYNMQFQRYALINARNQLQIIMSPKKRGHSNIRWLPSIAPTAPFLLFNLYSWIANRGFPLCSRSYLEILQYRLPYVSGGWNYSVEEFRILYRPVVLKSLVYDAVACQKILVDSWIPRPVVSHQQQSYEG